MVVRMFDVFGELLELEPRINRDSDGYLARVQVGGVYCTIKVGLRENNVSEEDLHPQSRKYRGMAP